jgi:putative mRNA 3-end processing factor
VSRFQSLLETSPAGLYSPAGGFHIDPMRPVERALITHGHSDHARAGHGAVLATRETLAIMALRLGPDFAGRTQAIAYGEQIAVGDARVSFHPAGHIFGSAQIAVEQAGIRAVASGDYKRAGDPTCAPFELVSCDLFVSEATFGLPVFRHPPAGEEIGKLLRSLTLFPERAHLVGAYALGKAQRLIMLLRAAGYDAPIYLHGAIERLTSLYAREGFEFGDVLPVAGRDRRALGGAIVIAPPSALHDLWARKFGDPVTSFASGWMRIRARARQGAIELPLVISDHADWPELCATIADTGCGEVWLTHGEGDALAHVARARGVEARVLDFRGYGDEEADADAAVPA